MKLNISTTVPILKTVLQSKKLKTWTVQSKKLKTWAELPCRIYQQGDWNAHWK